MKVEDSMENLEEVVKERNRAYYELETGTTGSVHKSFSLSLLNANTDTQPWLVQIIF